MTRRTRTTSAGLLSNRTALLWIVVISSFLARCIVLLLSRDTFLWDGIWSDAATYDQWARRIVASDDWVGQTPFFMSPFYSYVLALTYSIFGESYLAVRILQVFAGTATAVLIYLVGEKLFTRRAAFVAALLAALYGPFLLSGILLLVETLKVFFLILTLWLLIVAERKPSLVWWLLPGLSLGCAVLCRPTDLLVLVVACLWIVLVLKADRGGRLRRVALLVTGVALIVGPVTARNYLVSGEFVLVTSNGGLNFYLGNNRDAVGVYYNVDRLDLVNDPDGRLFLETQTGRTLTHSEASSLWMDKAWAFVLGDPAAALALLAKKFLLFFHHKEISQVGYNYVFVSQQALPILTFLPAFLIVCPLGILGCVWGWQRRRELFLLYAFLFAGIVSVVLFFMTDRFRLSSIPFFMLFAGFAVDRIAEKVRGKKWGDLRIPALLVGAVCAIMTVLNIHVPDEFSLEWEQIGLMHLNARDPRSALKSFQESAKYKDSYHLRNNIGNAYAAMGQAEAALEQFRTGEGMNPAQPVSAFSIGTAYAAKQDWMRALEAFDRAIGINPRFAPARLNKGLVLYYMQRFDEALAELRIYTTLESDQSKLASVYGDIRNLERLVEQQRAGESSGQEVK